jgi:cysteine desulfurase
MVAAPRTYLDHNATAPLRPQARAAMVAALEAVGKPSSVHADGRAARAVVEQARDAVAALAGAMPVDVVFTSGGTEANAMALAQGAATRLLVGAGEHVCVLEGHGFSRDDTEVVPLLSDGRIDLAWLEQRLAGLAGDGQRPLVALQLANNETGVLQPVRAAADLAHAAGGVLHCDAVQAAGRIALDITALGVDTMALSAHKIGGPQGAGALIMRPGHHLAAWLRGGGQERGRRAGTENVAGIAGFGAAAAVAREMLAAEAGRLAALRDHFEQGVLAAAPDTVIFGRGAPRLPNTSSFALPGLTAETALIAFDLSGIALSSGAACASGKVARSHVLDAMGVEPALAAGALRASLGWSTTESDVSLALRGFAKVVSALRHRQGRRAA